MTPIDKPIHPPREGDLPRDELQRRAQLALDEWSSGGADVDILFKFTCVWCGERCTLQEPNKLYENGECFACGKSTPIKWGGFSIHAKLNPVRDENKETKEKIRDRKPNQRRD